MSAVSDPLVPGLPLSREQALALPGMRRYCLVEFLVRWEHFGAARELLESLASQKSGPSFYQYRLAQCYLATGEIERAREVARALHAAPSTRAIGLLAVGDVLYVEGRLAQAEEFYGQALQIEKTRESAQRRLAWCLLHRRNLNGAAELVQQLTGGKRPAQLAPPSLRLLAAVAGAKGEAESAAGLRRELKQRWQQELARLRAALDLAGAPADPESEPAPEPAPSPAPPAEPEVKPEEGVKGGQSAGLIESPREEAASSPPSATPEPPHSARGARDRSESPRPETRPVPSGYVYPTARERRAVQEAALRQASRPAPAPDARASMPKPGEPGKTSEPLDFPRFSPPTPPTAAAGTPASDRRQGAPATAPAPVVSQPADHSLQPQSVGSGALRTALQELFGYEQFRPGQEEVVRHVLEGRSVLATMPTGRGKSLCFQLPAMLLPRTAVVISPLIALMQDQIEGLPPRVRQRATVLNSSMDSAALEERLRQLPTGRYALVYAAPERLRQRPFLHALGRAGVSLLVVDEAHCISLWGQDFRPDYLFLPQLLRELGCPPLLAMTATATPAMQCDIREQFGVPMETISQGVFRPNLFLEVRSLPNREARLKTLKELCREETGSILVYVSARARAEHLAQALGETGISAGFYHAGLPAEQREEIQQQFMADRLRCLVATIAFGMGVDKPDIRLIIHYDLPRSLESYYQEAGRAGRDGEPARCVLFASPAARGNLSRWAREDRLPLGDVLRVHTALTAMTGHLTIATDDLERETELDETRLRVAISLLERAGALRRGYDLPRVATLRVLAKGDARFTQFITDARLRPGQRMSRDTEELCALTGIAPDQIEPCLLDWATAGWMEYRGSARGLRLQLQPVSGLETRIRDLLLKLEALEETRLRRLDGYLRGAGCRHRFLSDYFGHPLPLPRLGAGCEACDRCAARVSRFWLR